MKLFARQASGRKDSGERLPLELNRRRVYIFPTRHGFVFMGVLLAMLLGAINYNNNLGFLLVFLLGGIALAGLFHTYRNLHGLILSAVTARPVFAGEVAFFTLTVRAGSRPRRAVCFFLEKERLVLENLATGEDTVVNLGLGSQNRGYLRPDRLTVFTRFPLGLFQAWSVLRPEAACLVYPAPRAGRPRPTEEGSPFSEEDGAVLTRPGADDFDGLRPYQPGHPVRQIAWKALSRGQGVYIKNFMTGGGGAVFDYESTPGDDPEEKLSRLCHMIITAGAMNLTYGLKIPGTTIAPGSGPDHQHTCLRSLALFQRPEQP
ncbi:MAG: DUF58 domain-containing protein [Desulfosudaceae bacterium]